MSSKLSELQTKKNRLNCKFIIIMNIYSLRNQLLLIKIAYKLHQNYLTLFCISSVKLFELVRVLTDFQKFHILRKNNYENK